MTISIKKVSRRTFSRSVVFAASGLAAGGKTLELLAQVQGEHINTSHAHPVPAIQDEETPEQKNARMQWFREARFGMFIHWGLYAIPDNRSCS